MSRSFSTILKHLPGRIRVAFLFGLIIPIVVLPLWIDFVERPIEANEVWIIILMWVLLVAASAVLGYMLTLLAGLLLWVQEGFDVAIRIKTMRMIFRAIQISLILAFGFLIAIYTRYDVVALMDQSG